MYTTPNKLNIKLNPKVLKINSSINSLEQRLPKKSISKIMKFDTNLKNGKNDNHFLLDIRRLF